jgi:protein disulfide-isomerase A6
VEESQERPIVVEETIPPIPTLATTLELVQACLMQGASTCVLAFVPTEQNEMTKQALSGLAEIAYKHKHAKRNLFPFYAVPDETTEAASLKKTLGRTSEVMMIAVNRKRGWYTGYESNDFSTESIEIWIDKIRMGEVRKERLPEVMEEKTANVAKDVPLETPVEEASPEPTEVVDEESITVEEAAEANIHDEL